MPATGCSGPRTSHGGARDQADQCQRLVGFSPRKQNISIYIMAGFSGSERLLAKRGKHKIGKSCLYIKRLDDVDQVVLRKLLDGSIQYMRNKYTTGK